LHQKFRELTGSLLPVSGIYLRERQWLAFVEAGITEQDLETVIRYLQKEIRADRRRPGCLKFANLIGPRYEDDGLNGQRDCAVDLFLEELSQARAAARNYLPPPSTKDAVLRATGRPDSQDAKVERGPVLAGEALSRKLSELSKEINKGTA
jgi:hypothetical protein